MNSNQEVKTIIENTVNSCKYLETNELLDNESITDL